MNNFEKTKREILEKRKKHKTWEKIVTVLCCFCIVITTYGLVSPAVAISTDVLYCTKDEHQHTEECYSNDFLCEKEEHEHALDCYEFDRTLICEEEHEHESGCYDINPILVCTKDEHEHNSECRSLICENEEHIHTNICYSNQSADKDPEEWENKVPELVGNWKKDLALVAESQLGYSQSTVNFVEEDGQIKYYNIYSANYSDWNLPFINWCLEKANIPSNINNNYHQYIPQAETADVLMYTAMTQGKYSDNTYPYDEYFEYVPEVGDLAISYNDNYETLVSVVTGLNYENVNGDNVLVSVDVIMGNVNGTVSKVEYEFEDENLVGFINVPDIDVTTNDQEDNNDDYYHFDDDSEIGGNAWEDNSIFPGFSLFTNEAPGEGYVALTDSQVQAVLITWKYPDDTTDTWISANNLPEGVTIPANAVFRIAIDYAHVEPSDLQNGTEQYSKKLYYKVDDILKNINTTGKVFVDGEEKGIIGTETINGGTYITIQFDNNWVSKIVENNNSTEGGSNYKTIAGDFYYQGSLDLSNIEDESGSIITLAGININLPDKNDAIAKYASVDFKKSIANNSEIEKIGDYYYITYELKVKAGEYGCPDVKLIDTLSGDGTDFVVKTINSVYDGGYQDISCTKKIGEAGEESNVGITHYLTNDTKPTKVVSGETPTYVINNVNDGSNIAFELGDLTANEIRTITYKVRVNSNYVGVPRDNRPINNTAKLFSKEYSRGIEEESYKPNMGADVVKSSTTPVKNENGTFTIDYTITVSGKTNNSYTLTNVKINDLMNYDWYHGSAYKDCIKSISNIVVKNQDGTVYNQTPVVNNTNKTFSTYIGDLAPGETKTITYSITFNPADAELIANGNVKAYNKVNVMSDDTKGEQLLGTKNVENTVSSHTWTSKSSPSQVLQDQTLTINPTDKVFNLSSNGTLTQVTSNKPTSTTVNAGTFRYTVEINRDGLWDTKAANMHDGFGQNSVNGNNVHLLQFDGYLRVDAYPKNDANNAITGTPAKTYWVNINDLTSFDLKAEDIVDPTDNTNYAYKLTYYAKYSNESDWGKAYVSNSFNLSGSVVGNDGNPVNLAGITQTITTTFVEPGSETPTKSFWYYNKADNAFDDFKINGQNNGALYWYASVGGSKVSKGTAWEESVRIRDNGNWTGGDESAPRSLIRKNAGTDNGPSYLGFYLVDTRDENGIQRNFSDVFVDYNAFLAELNKETGSKIEEVSADKYRVEFNRNFLSGTDKSYWDFSITFTESYAIPEGKMLYMLVRTQPSVLPGPNAYLDYVNKINYKTTSMSGWEHPTAKTMIHSESDGVYKKTGGVYDIKNNTINLIPGSGIDQTNKILSNVVNLTTNDQSLDSINEQWPGHNYSSNGNVTYSDGKYITWYITVNKLKTLNGDYYIEDYLPEGLDLVYVRPYDVKSVFREPSKTGDNATYDDMMRWNTFYIGPGLTQKGPTIPGNKLNAVGINVNEGWCFTPNGIIDDIGADWQLHLTASTCDNNSGYVWTGDNRTALIYYTRDNVTTGGTDIKMFFPYITPGETDVTVQVVAKLNSDSSHDLLFGDLDFNNQVVLYDKTGRLIDERGAEVTVGGGNVNKNLLTDGLFKESDSSTIIKTSFPYSITINSEEADMVSDSDYISLPLIDRMTSNLSIINSTLKIYKNEAIDDADYLLYYGGIYTDNESANGKPWYVETGDPKIGKSVGYLGTGTPIVVSLKDSEDKTGNPYIGPNGIQMKEIRFTNLPDETHLIISYSVSATIANSNNVFKNEAYWEGYEENKGGDTEVEVNKYEAQSSAQTETHGALHIMKFDANNEAERLAGAEFTLYRAKYVESSNNMLEFESDATNEIKAKRYLAVYMGNDYSETSNDPEVKVIRDKNGDISGFYQPGQSTVTSINNIKTLGIKLHHKLDLDDNGNIQYYDGEVLASGKTDANGNLSYGFTSDYGVDNTGTDKDRIHFNKIYCLIETEAPTGYDPDPTEHYFVIPSDLPQNNGQGKNYFYHEQWPSGVHVCTLTENGMPTYVLGVPNYKQQLKVTKDFKGTNHVYKPATYEFGIWNEANGLNPTKESMLHKISITFTEDDFGYYEVEDIYEYEHDGSIIQYRKVGNDIESRNVITNNGVNTYTPWQQSGLTTMPSGVSHWKYYRQYKEENDVQQSRLIKVKVGTDVIHTDEFVKLPDGTKIPNNLTYGILPGHNKSTLFPYELEYGNYYVYELNDSGYAIANGKGTISGQLFTVSITGDACVGDYGKVTFDAEHKDITVTNETYSVNVTKNFKDAGGKDLDIGLSGTYRFAIWPEEEVVDGVPVTNPIASRIKTITWTLSDIEREKTCEFTDLQGSKKYYVFELDVNNKPIVDSSIGIVNGNMFVVNYDSKNADHSINTTIGTSPTVVVSNSSTVTLPETGGLGVEKLPKVGMLLASFSILMLINKKR